VALAWDSIKASFGFPSGLAMLAGAVVGLSLPSIDEALGIAIPALTFDSQSAARSLLETIATATTAVAGLSFSVTVVAITLASNQLSPRVLRSFRGDRLSQITLALFLGTFVYSLAVLVRIGVSGGDARPPNLSMTLAVLLTFASFATFAAFIAHILRMLQPSSVIDSIHEDAVGATAHLYPCGPGEPQSHERAILRAASVMDAFKVKELRAAGNGYLTVIDTASLIEAATEADAVIRQRVLIGTYVVPGQVIAEAGIEPGVAGGQTDRLAEAMAGAANRAFVLGQQRTLVQDIAFPVRQLADVALKGLSPGINDPTTAANAMDAMGSFLVEFAHCELPCPVRVDKDGEVRLIALAPDLDDLVRLGFEQVRIAASTHPVISARLLVLLDLIDGAVARRGGVSAEAARQRRLIEADTD
jgi:uncharacterized membrane protein